MKFWMTNQETQQIVIGNVEFETMDQAYQSAVAWNHQETRKNMFVDFIANAPVLKEATSVRAVLQFQFS